MIDITTPPLSIPAEEALASLRSGIRPHSAWRMLNDLDHFYPNTKFEWHAVTDTYTLTGNNLLGHEVVIERALSMDEAVVTLWEWAAQLLS